MKSQGTAANPLCDSEEVSSSFPLYVLPVMSVHVSTHQALLPIHSTFKHHLNIFLSFHPATCPYILHRCIC